MVLSNARKCFLPAVFCAVSLLGCGGKPAIGNLASPQPPEPTSEYPFLTKEPEVYRAEIVATGGGFEKKWFVTRKQDRWRIDFFEGARLLRSRVRNDAVYSIDHDKKVYSVVETPGETVTDLTSRIFKGKEYRKFEKVGSANGVTRYRSQVAEGKGVIIVTIDDATGLMIRTELPANEGSTVEFAYDLRNLKYEVDDAAFDVPAGYRKVQIQEGERPNERR